MEIGTAEPIKQEKKKKLRRRPDLSRLSGPGNGGGTGGGNDDDSSGSGGGGSGGNPGDSLPKKKPVEEQVPEPTNKSRILMIFLLSVVVMTFGGLIGAYVVIATNKAAEWQPFTQLPIQVWFSTAIILASSVSYHFAKSALIKGQSERAKKWFITTTVLGGLFISSQLIVWLSLINRGYILRGDPYAGFFYILTAVHAVHVLGGIVALGYIVLRTWNKARSKREIEKQNNDATAIGWYWHTMDLLWLVLLFLLGYIK